MRAKSDYLKKKLRVNLITNILSFEYKITIYKPGFLKSTFGKLINV